MSGPEGFRDVAIIFAALIGIANQQPDRRTGSTPLMDTRKEFDFVGFAPLRDMARCAGPAPVQFGLDIGRIQWQTRGAAGNHRAYCRPSSFGKLRHGEEYGQCSAGPDAMRSKAKGNYNLDRIVFATYSRA